jgi:hypothetical protein
MRVIACQLPFLVDSHNKNPRPIVKTLPTSSKKTGQILALPLKDVGIISAMTTYDRGSVNPLIIP